ncbi:MAG TPA: hypothetical protein VM241_04750 [Candidatus Thermoplasmatota archaeon]|nr:hypothetical protein [Candidatus Thermoplasmatota archaeon]
MARRAVDLFSLLPAHHRQGDAAGALRATLDAVSAQLDLVKRDVDGLWDDLFVETAAPWALPYIGDLVGNLPLHEGAGLRRRADVANTIHYRRRKGTQAMLEQLARDVTGWDAVAVPYFEHLLWEQNVNHVRRALAPNPGLDAPRETTPAQPPDFRHPNTVSRVGTANLRDAEQMDRVGGPFDTVAHTVDVRPFGAGRGRHNIPKIGFFLWRLQAFPLHGATARLHPAPAQPYGFTFSQLGLSGPLFNNPRRQHDADGLAREEHVAGPIRPHALYLDLKDHKELGAAGPDTDKFYGPGRPFSIRLASSATPIPPGKVVCKDLSGWDQPKGDLVAVDAALGRIAFGPDAAGPATLPPADGVVVSYSYGFSAPMGGGPYDRSAATIDPKAMALKVVVRAAPLPTDTATIRYASTLNAALGIWRSQGCPNCVIEVADSRLYHEAIALPGPANPTSPKWDAWLVLRAASGERPNLRLDAGLTVEAGDHSGAALTLNGLLVEGGIAIKGRLGELNLDHCTLVPAGAPSVTAVEAVNQGLRVNLSSSITGALRLPGEAEALCVQDSIVDALSPTGVAISEDGVREGPPTTVRRSTVLGRAVVRELAYASEAIFTGRVDATRRQSGCARFSHIPHGSTAPRRYRCQPDDAIGGEQAPALVRRIARLQEPCFTSTTYGDPGYAQLACRTPETVRAGAEDGSEMGAFCALQQPQRLANLRLRLDEYLPFGLEPGLIQQT